MWPKEKTATVGDRQIKTVSNKIVKPDYCVIIETTATVDSVVYQENWTLPHGNHEYSQAQAQTDFEAHIAKVAKETVGRFVAHSVSEGLE
jgi:hypothetical protein